jgi:hypothetical protein
MNDVIVLKPRHGIRKNSLYLNSRHSVGLDYIGGLCSKETQKPTLFAVPLTGIES